MRPYTNTTIKYYTFNGELESTKAKMIWPSFSLFVFLSTAITGVLQPPESKD